jgi:hypothetical protein
LHRQTDSLLLLLLTLPAAAAAAAVCPVLSLLATK